MSASTLAEDVRQLAHWCRSADEAREQQEGRLDQLERVPPLQAQLKALQDRVSSLLLSPSDLRLGKGCETLLSAHHTTYWSTAACVKQHVSTCSFVGWTSAFESCRTAWQD